MSDKTAGAMEAEMREKPSSNRDSTNRRTVLGIQTTNVDNESGGDDPEGRIEKPRVVTTRKGKRGMDKFKYHTVYRGKVQRATYTGNTFQMFNPPTIPADIPSTNKPDGKTADGNNNQEKYAVIRDVKQLNDRIKTGELKQVTQMTFTDEDQKLSKLPPKLSACTNLTHLTVTLSKVATLPSYLSDLKLSHVDFRENNITNVDGLMNSKTLIVLDLSRNQLISLPASIGKLPSIQVLNVNGNRIRNLPNEITSLSTLTELQCSSNMLKNLPDTMGNLESLKSLDISSNPISVLPQSLGNLGNLTDLRATGAKLKAVPSTMDSMFGLKHLFLSNNELGIVPPVFQQLPSLETVALKKNGIKVVTTTMTKLKSLVLDENEITCISSSLLGCSNLEALSMQRNKLQKVPPNIGLLKKLRSLQLGYNAIEQIPGEISDLVNLSVMSLRGTKIQTLPPSVARMDKLSSIDLHFTKLGDSPKRAYEEGVGALKRYLAGSRQTEKPTISRKPNQRESSSQNLKSNTSDGSNNDGGSASGGSRPGSAKNSVSSDNEKM